MGAKGNISFFFAFMRMQIASAFEYKLNFIVQSFGMLLNDAVWVFFWYLIFSRFGNIGSWRFNEMLMLYALITTGFGLALIIFGNFMRGFAQMIENGGLDYYLTLPKNVLMHSLMRTVYSGAGDFIFGIGIAIFILPAVKVPLFIVLILCIVLIFISWGIISQSLTFFFGRFQRASDALGESLLMISSNPFSVYSGATKFVLLFIIPAGFIAGVPVDLLTVFNWKWLSILIAFSVFILFVAVAVFYIGLRKYESGNTMAMKG